MENIIDQGHTLVTKMSEWERLEFLSEYIDDLKMLKDLIGLDFISSTSK